MKSKKGFLLGEYTLKMIIGVLCVLLLLYLLFVFYSSFTDKQNFQRAEATLESLSEKMVDAKSGAVSLPLLEPNGWKLISYSGAEKPEACTSTCICLCADRIRDKWKIGQDQIDKCDVRGVCKNFDDKINDFNIKIRVEVDIEYKNGGYIIKEENAEE